MTAEALLGVLMLEARFERIVGDIGNPDTFRYPVMHRVVPGATVSRVCDQDDNLVDLFAAHADQLVKAGVTAITTSCGFMARHQSKLEKRVKVPFAASALCLLSDTRRRYGKVGVITADSSQLGEDHFTACGSAPPVAVAGMQDYPAFSDPAPNRCTATTTDRGRGDRGRGPSVRTAPEAQGVAAGVHEPTPVPKGHRASNGSSGHRRVELVRRFDESVRRT